MDSAPPDTVWAVVGMQVVVVDRGQLLLQRSFLIVQEPLSIAIGTDGKAKERQIRRSKIPPHVEDDETMRVRKGLGAKFADRSRQKPKTLPLGA